MKKTTYLSIFILISLLNLNAIAQDKQHHDNNKSEQKGSHSIDATHSKGHVLYQHHIAVFGGMTSNLTHEVNLLTFGLDYECRLGILDKKFGVGLNAEYLTGDHTEKIFGIPIFYHPVRGLKFDFAPMFAIVEEFSEGGHEPHESEEIENINEFGLRVGAIYDIHFNQFSISPTLNLDYIGESWAVAFGVAFGIGFHKIE